jgi:hypothetical protein
LYCKKYMTNRTEAEIQSVFDHWIYRNQDDMFYGEMKRKVADRGMSVNRMASEVGRASFASLTMIECFEVDDEDSVPLWGADDDE